jgi:prolyl oligopeptidase
MVKIGDQSILFRNESLLSPPAWYSASVTNSQPVKSSLAKESAADFSGCEVVRETATSKDGASIPIMILRPKGLKMDGSNPTLLWGYGGYSISEQPTFSEIRMLWAEQGGVFAIANIRGGGEFGEEWHKAGNLTHKQNVFDDFYAAMEQLKKDGYCTTDKLAIYGGSNGGLLMGAMITQHPEACRAVVSAVGIYDMLRVELSSNGAFNVTEFGTVKNEDEFKAMFAYSPYHHVADGTKYPSILMMTGANDPRVDPMQSRKMVARLQAATTSGRPVLLRTSMTSGHGIGSSLNERIEQDVDRYAFLFHELGVDYKPVK